MRRNIRSEAAMKFRLVREIATFWRRLVGRGRTIPPLDANPSFSITEKRRSIMPGRVSVTVDGTKFRAIEAVFAVNTQKDAAGMPVLQTMNTHVKVFVDIFDDQDFPFDYVKKMFNLANVPDRSKLKEIKIEYWKDDRMEDVICSFGFKGWISKFEVYNPVLELNEHPLAKDASSRVYNHVLCMELEPIVNKENFQEIQISN
jgi:hypothetical protein